MRRGGEGSWRSGGREGCGRDVLYEKRINKKKNSKISFVFALVFILDVISL